MANETKIYSASLLAALALIAATPAEASATKLAAIDSSASLSTTAISPMLSMDENGQVFLGALNSDAVLQGAYGVSAHEVEQINYAGVNLHCPRNTNCGDKCGA